MFYHCTVVLILLVGGVVFAQMFRGRVRDTWTPIVFSLIIFTQACRISTHNVLFTYFTLFMSSVGSAFLVNGYNSKDMRRNFVLNLFLLFWGYMLLSMFWGECKMSGLFLYLHVLVGPIAVGYFTGMWAIKDERRWQRLCLYILIVVLLVCVVYAWKGIFSGSVEGKDYAQAQAGFSGDMAMGEEGGTNVNQIGLAVAGLLSIPFVAIFMRFDAIKFLANKKWLVNCLGAGLVLTLALIIVRLGSRNCSLAFIPLIWYGLFARIGGGRIKKWMLVGCVVLALLFLVGRNMGKNTELRMFKYTNDTTTIFDDSFGGNRLGFFRDRLYGLPTSRYYWGNGALIDSMRGVVGNGHSVYFQVFFQSGFVGLGLMLIFYVSIACQAFSANRMKCIGVLMVGIWVVTGVGEAQNILLGGVSKYFMGMGIAFFTTQSCPMAKSLMFTNRRLVE